MTFIASYTTLIKKGGTPTSFTDEAFTTITADQIFQITDSNKQIFDPSTATTFTFYEDDVAIDDAEIEYVDMMQGIVKFVNADKTGVITADGKYIPVSAISFANEASLSVNQELVDATTFESAYADDGFKTMVPTMRDASLTLGGFFDTGNPYFTGFSAATNYLIDFVINGATEKQRGWFIIESDEISSNISDLASLSLSFQANDLSSKTDDYEKKAYFSLIT